MAQHRYSFQDLSRRTPRRSLVTQVAEVDREIEMRASVYPGRVGAGKMREAEAEYQLDTMRAVRRTLQWVADAEPEIRALIEARREADD